MQDAADKKLESQIKFLQDQYNDLAFDESDAGMSKRSELKGKLRRLTHDQIHPGEDWVHLNVPPSVTGEPFTINEVAYVNEVTVPACVAQTLLYMIDQNRRVELDRMRESGRSSVLGNLGGLATQAFTE